MFDWQKKHSWQTPEAKWQCNKEPHANYWDMDSQWNSKSQREKSEEPLANDWPAGSKWKPNWDFKGQNNWNCKWQHEFEANSAWHSDQKWPTDWKQGGTERPQESNFDQRSDWKFNWQEDWEQPKAAQHDTKCDAMSFTWQVAHNTGRSLEELSKTDCDNDAATSAILAPDTSNITLQVIAVDELDDVVIDPDDIADLPSSSDATSESSDLETRAEVLYKTLISKIEQLEDESRRERAKAIAFEKLQKCQQGERSMKKATAEEAGAVLNWLIMKFGVVKPTLSSSAATSKSSDQAIGDVSCETATNKHVRKAEMIKVFKEWLPTLFYLKLIPASPKLAFILT